LAPSLTVGFLPDSSAFGKLAVESRSLKSGYGFVGEGAPEPLMVVKRKIAIEPNGVGVHERLCRARRFIDECYDLPLDLNEISKQACLSRFFWS
jgi:hypothetical protein